MDTTISVLLGPIWYKFRAETESNLSTLAVVPHKGPGGTHCFSKVHMLKNSFHIYVEGTKHATNFVPFLANLNQKTL